MEVNQEGEEILWSGKAPISVRARQFIFNFFWLWAATFPPIIVMQIISFFVIDINLMSIFWMSFLMMIILFFLQTFAGRWGLMKDIYIITNRKVRWEREEEWAEILLSEIVDFKVNKSYFDDKEKNTGTISFRERTSKKFWLKFEHIVQVDQVSELLTKILPNLYKEFPPIESSDELLPDDIAKFFSKTETLLFKIKNVSKERMDKVHKYIFIATLSFLAVYIPLFIVFLGILNILGVVILIIGPVTVLMTCLDRFSWMHKEREQFIYVTNKKFYYFHQRFVKEIPFASLKAVNFKRRGRQDGRGDVIFITGKKRIEEYCITNVPNVSYCQRVIESVLYEYGNIEQRWQTIKNKLKIQMPARFHISEKGLNFMNKRFRKTALYMGLVILITGIIALIFYLSFQFLVTDQFTKVFFQFLFIIFTLILGSVPIIWYILERHRMHKRTVLIDKDSLLTFHEHQIVFAGIKAQQKIPLAETVYLNLIKIKKPMDPPTKWEIYDGLKIQSTKNLILFGPVDNFWDVYEFSFSFFILWKGQKGLLFSKQEIESIL